ncbi:MAG: helix-turn-helix domain-containing protein [Gemmataceae bacterium]
MTATTPVAERLTVDRLELAAMLGVGRKTIDRHRGDLPTPIRVGRRLLWSRAEVMTFLRTKKAGPAGVPA